MILIALGSSIGFCGLTPQSLLPSALRALGRIVRVERVSRLYESPAWPDPTDPPFVNAVAMVETGLSCKGLLAALHAVEAGFGRRRTVRNGPRTLDLDLLDFDGLVRHATPGETLELPHPRVVERDFTLLPLAEVAPDWRHPVTGESVSALISALATSRAKPVQRQDG